MFDSQQTRVANPRPTGTAWTNMPAVRPLVNSVVVPTALISVNTPSLSRHRRPGAYSRSGFRVQADSTLTLVPTAVMSTSGSASTPSFSRHSRSNWPSERPVLYTSTLDAKEASFSLSL